MKKFLKIAISLFLGVISMACVSCGGSGNHIISESDSESSVVHTHEYNETITKSPTCTQEGEKALVCSCGDIKTLTIGTLGHDIKQYEAQTPTCTQFGWNAYEECLRGGCDYTTYQEIKANGHTYVKGVCTVKDCGMKQPSEEHVECEWNEGIITTQPTCTERGVKTYTCWCTDSYTESVDALGHDKEQHEGKEATCTEKGWKPYETCKREGCDYTTYEEIEINPGNHDYQNLVCSRCGDKKPSEGLEYTLSDDSTYYSVTDIGGCTDTDIVIPEKYKDLPVKEIAGSAFERCDSLTSVVIPDSVTSIGFMAFYECTSLTSVAIPDSVTSIDMSAFSYCDSLTSVVIPDSVTTIGGGAFYYCRSLTSVVIGNSVTSIGTDAFYQTGCFYDESNWKNDGLYIGKYLIVAENTTTDVYTIKDGTLCIAENAFVWCESLKSVVIPDSVTSISNYAFDGCTRLTSITFNGTIEEWNAIEKGDYWNGYGNYKVPAKEVVCTNGSVALG